MEKIFLAIGNRDMEDFLKRELQSEVQFVGETVYREGVKKGINQFAPSVVIIKESLMGAIDMLRLLYEIKTDFPNVRIIYIGPDKSSADNFYTTLVNYGVYDLIVGGKVRVADVITKIRIPSKHSDVKHYQPAPPKVTPGTVPASAPIILEDEDEEEEMGEQDEVFDVLKADEKTEEDGEKSSGKENLFMKLKKKASIPVLSKKDGEMDGEEGEPPKKKFPPIKKEVAQESIEDVSGKMFSKDKIITFIGGRSGVGTTTIAVNTAFDLAMKGNKVLYLEVNKKHPSATYWFDIGQENLGIDVALHAIEEKKYSNVFNSIVKTADLKKSNGAMKANYKKFPDTLDFMSYSGGYLLDMFKKEELPELKELYLYLLYQGKYDFVIVDLSFFSSERDIQGAMLYSNKVFTVLNQDISTVGYHLAFLKKLKQDGVDVGDKNHYIINSFARSKFGMKDLQDWLNVSQAVAIPNSIAEVSESNSTGLPTILFQKRSEFSTSIKQISKIIGGK